MSSTCSYEELLKHHGLSEEDCGQQVSNKHLALFSLSLCGRWKMLPALLDMEPITAEDAAKDAGNEEGKRYRFLLKWSQSQGFQATYKKLILALLELKCAQDAGQVCRRLKESLSAEGEEFFTPPSSPSAMRRTMTPHGSSSKIQCR